MRRIVSGRKRFEVFAHDTVRSGLILHHATTHMRSLYEVTFTLSMRWARGGLFLRDVEGALEEGWSHMTRGRGER